MDNAIRMILHHLMTDRQNRLQTQQAMMYGHKTQKMDSKQFASYLSADGLKDASDLELYILLVLFYDSTKNEEYNPHKYFSDEEIAKYEGRTIYQLQTFKVLEMLNDDEYLSTMNWMGAVKLIKKVSIAQKTTQYSNHRLIIADGTVREGAAEFITQQMKSDLYLPPLIGINVVPDIYQIEARHGTVQIPLDVPTCRVVAPAELVQAINLIEDIDEFVRSVDSKRLVPVRITNFTAFKMGLKTFSKS